MGEGDEKIGLIETGSGQDSQREEDREGEKERERGR